MGFVFPLRILANSVANRPSTFPVPSTRYQVRSISSFFALKVFMIPVPLFRHRFKDKRLSSHCQDQPAPLAQRRLISPAFHGELTNKPLTGMPPSPATPLFQVQQNGAGDKNRRIGSHDNPNQKGKGKIMDDSSPKEEKNHHHDKGRQGGE